MCVILHDLKNEEFMHPFDKDAMKVINAVPGFESFTEWILHNSVEVFYNIQWKGSSIRLNEKNSPRVYNIYRQTAEILGVNQLPDIYLQRGYNFLNRIIGYHTPMILLHTNCVERLDDTQLRFILGRCLSGIMLKHNKFEFFCDIVNAVSTATLPIVSSLALPLSQWHRKSELSRDRGGLLAAQDFEASMRTMMLMSGVPYGEEKNIDVYDYLDQAMVFRKSGGLEKMGRVTMTALSQDAWMIDRATELYLWHDMGGYDKVIMEHEP